MGGNIWVNSDPINAEHIVPTTIKYFEELGRILGEEISKEILDNCIFIGSTGKSRISGDIDICININALYPANNRALSDYHISETDYESTLIKLTNRARTATKQNLSIKAFLKELSKVINDSNGDILIDEKKIDYNSMFSQFDQYDNDNIIDKKVQVDWIFSENMDWAEFAYHSSNNSNYKGLHRTQLLISLLSNMDYGFSHSYGYYEKNKKDTTLSTSIVNLLEIINNYYVLDINKEDLDSFETMYSFINTNLYDSDDILDIYLGILDKTRTEIPTVLHKYYKENKERLNLTGKFLTKPVS